MRFNKELTIFAMCLFIFAFTSCAMNTTTGESTLDSQKIQQVTTAICTPLQTVLTDLSVPGLLNTTEQKNLQLITPMVSAICTTGETVTITDLQTFNTQGMPALLSILNASPLSARDKQIGTLSVIIAQGVLSGYIVAHPVTPTVVTPVAPLKLGASMPTDRPFIIVPDGVTLQQVSNLKLVPKSSK